MCFARIRLMHSGHLQHTEKFTNFDLCHSHSTVSTHDFVDMLYIYILSNAVDLMCLPCFFLVFVVYKLTLIRTLPPERFTLTTPATLAQLRSTLQCDSAGTSGSDVGTAQPETDEARCLSWRMYLYRERLEKDPCKYDRICS